MNERIRELAEQSCFDEIGKDYSLYFNLTKDKVERFAELIIRECARVIDRGNGEVCSTSEHMWCNICRDDILKHFGIEK